MFTKYKQDYSAQEINVYKQKQQKRLLQLKSVYKIETIKTCFQNVDSILMNSM